MDRQARIRSMVDEHTPFVARMLRKAGVPGADLDDEVQRTFIIAARRVDDVELGAERKFLAQVAVHLASHSRRKFARRREVMDDRPIERSDAFATPEHLTDRKQMRALLDGIVASMPEPLRTVFTLHELEEMKLTEIAAVVRVPRGTVASRLRRAREHFREHVLAIGLAWDVGSAGARRMDERASTRREYVSALQRGLLRAGKSMPGFESARAKTLAVLGLLFPPAYQEG